MADDLQSLSPAELVKRRDRILNSFSTIESEFDHRRKENRLIVKAGDIQWEAAAAVHPTQQEGHRLARIISPELGFDIHTFRVFQRQIASGGVDGAYHTHGDAVKYYLRGKGREIIGETEYVVEAGDLAFIPANVWHGTESDGEEAMEFIAFHQIPGTHLPVPASWQYEMSDMEGRESLEEFLASTSKENPSLMNSATLYSRRQHFLHELGILDDEFNRRRQQMRCVIPRKDIPLELPGREQRSALVAPELGFNLYTLQVSIRIVPSGKQEAHSHSHGEAVHYYLNGQGRQVISDEILDVEAGDLVFIPAGARHSISNSGDSPLRLLEAEQIPGTYLQQPTTLQDPL
ncbi:MAG: hypothetical protein BZY82_08445 [SAR202 cluster bacterium Io17-Chloro-G3]|nr:MAG: hypothetical protein BZY82_08445 [SAR202 cluster bacterium Io17-Chloro-G3]